MSDIVLEAIRSTILLVIFFNLWLAGKRRAELSRKGWNLLLAGFALLLFGSLIDLTDNFENLNRFVVIGDTPLQAFFEKLVGYLGGFFLIAVGLLIWIPTATSVDSLQYLTDQLEQQAAVLRRHEVKLSERAEELARTNNQLERERNLLSTLVENMPDAIYFKDRQSRLIRANPGACRIFGFDNEDAVLGKCDADFFDSEDANEYLSDEQRIIATNEPLIGKEEHERWQDGKMHWVLTTKMPLHDEQGSIVGTFGVSREITKQKEAELAFQKANEELQRSNVDLEHFAYVASHDLQEPLRAITGFVQLLSHNLGDDLAAENKEYIDFVVDGTKRMHVLINDLLEYSRAQTKNIEIAAVNMNQAVEQAKLQLKAVIDESGADIQCDNLPAVAADESQMVQLMQNLLGNAMKYRGEFVPTIQVSAMQEETEWIFSVKDNGIGIDPIFQDRIFLLFQRLHSREDYEGTGLGLAICQRIVQRHGGRIWVTSELGKGSVFNFSIPHREMPLSDTNSRALSSES